ncbi:uncharacterized protein EI90DRAFT_2712039 [Cantharellus anzutake]|uniref:uncharacterized protein n=1 Tax=Cantharellus anzutake TaxID=1750568 RepID=UPI001908E103|nr:uncharacterized protein EI90DRAFT_2712039 [Cantharellus anzutake]KAF8318345.1 hypothetical protein EI90DRAFT_2712039 [Cantharellus anzutake]
MKVASGDPMRTLEKLIDTGANRSKARAEEMMDSLYTTILKKCNWKDEDFVHDYPIVMGAILVAQQPLSVRAWDAILSPLLKSSIHHTLAELAPLLLGVREPDKPIRIYINHSTTSSDRTEPESSALHRYLVDTKRENIRVALHCVETLNEDLCRLDGLGLIQKLPEKVELSPIPPETLAEHFRYARRHVVCHLNQVLEPPERLNALVLAFLISNSHAG